MLAVGRQPVEHHRVEVLGEHRERVGVRRGEHGDELLVQPLHPRAVVRQQAVAVAVPDDGEQVRHAVDEELADQAVGERGVRDRAHAGCFQQRRHGARRIRVGHDPRLLFVLDVHGDFFFTPLRVLARDGFLDEVVRLRNHDAHGVVEQRADDAVVHEDGDLRRDAVRVQLRLDARQVVRLDRDEHEVEDAIAVRFVVADEGHTRLGAHGVHERLERGDASGHGAPLQHHLARGARGLELARHVRPHAASPDHEHGRSGSHVVFGCRSGSHGETRRTSDTGFRRDAPAYDTRATDGGRGRARRGRDPRAHVSARALSEKVSFAAIDAGRVVKKTCGWTVRVLDEICAPTRRLTAKVRAKRPPLINACMSRQVMLRTSRASERAM